MRITLDIEDSVLAAARALARAEGTTLGAAVSELARRGMRTTSPGVHRASRLRRHDPFPVVTGIAGHVVTDELVRQHRDA